MDIISGSLFRTIHSTNLSSKYDFRLIDYLPLNRYFYCLLINRNFITVIGEISQSSEEKGIPVLHYGSLSNDNRVIDYVPLTVGIKLCVLNVKTKTISFRSIFTKNR